MNKSQSNQRPMDAVTGFIHESQILPGTIKPRHLAASTTMKAGDIYYVGTDGIFHRLPIGTTGQKLTVSNNGLPVWS